MFLGQVHDDFPQCAEPELLVDPGRPQEPRVEGKGAQGIRQLPAVQLEQRRDAMDILSDGRVRRRQDVLRLLLGALLKAKSEKWEVKVKGQIERVIFVGLT